MTADIDALADPPQKLSRRAAKKAKRKQKKADKNRDALQAYLRDAAVGPPARDDDNLARNASTFPRSSVGGKASRARLVRQHDSGLVATFHPAIQTNSEHERDAAAGWEQHRPQGGAPILSQTLPHHVQIVEYLERKEREIRIRRKGIRMKERMAVEVDCHGSMESFKLHDNKRHGRGVHDLSRSRARGILSVASWSSLDTPSKAFSPSTIIHLDLSRNEMWDISADALEQLSSTCETLDISRNWFESLPESIGSLKELKELRASHNLLKPDVAKSLRLDALVDMNKLESIDLRFNQKCGRSSLLELLQSTLSGEVEVKLTVTYPCPPPDPLTVNEDKVGESPAVRDAKLLRSQLEPWSTMALRRRLVADFGEELTGDGRSWADADVSRGHVMNKLLSMYQEEAGGTDTNTIGCEDEHGRAVVHIPGILVNGSIAASVLHALKELWATSQAASRERPSICAENYMILCSPSMFESTSQKAAKAAMKLKKYQALWDLAFEAMKSVDPVFASQYTAVAVTHNFVGSPHIDKQNCGPFYGFAVGDFEEGTGNIVVECSARVVASVNTKNRIAKVDGRYPHWVAPYDSRTDRYSLIYYRTYGELEPIGPAVFGVPAPYR